MSLFIADSFAPICEFGHTDNKWQFRAKLIAGMIYWETFGRYSRENGKYKITVGDRSLNNK